MANQNNLYTFSEFHLTVIVIDIFLQQKGYQDWNSNVYDNFLWITNRKLWLTLFLQSCYASSFMRLCYGAARYRLEKNYFLGVTFLLVAFITWDKQGQSPVQNQILKNSSIAPSTFRSRQILPTGQTAIPILRIKYT